MPKKRKSSTLILALGLLVLLVGSLSGDEGAVATKTTLAPPVQGIPEALQAFDEMDTLLDMVIEWYDEAVDESVTRDDAAQLKGYVALLHKYKERVLKSMPDYLGLPFSWWHDAFNVINDWLDMVDAQSDRAAPNPVAIGRYLNFMRNTKEAMESEVRKQGS